VFVRYVLSMAALGGALWWLHRIPLGPTSPGDDGLTFAMVVVRVVAIASGCYLMVVTSLQAIGRWLALPRFCGVVDRLTLPFARGLFGGITLLGIVAAPSPPPPTPNDHATLHLLDDAAPVATPDAPEAPPAPPPPVSAPAPVETPAASDTWLVERGDSLWSIAATHLADRTGGPVTDAQIVPYWRAVIEANRVILVNPNDPNLLFCGQVVELPAVG
jgi:hypothetical protein